MHVKTDLPGIQFYSGNYLAGTIATSTTSMQKLLQYLAVVGTLSLITWLQNVCPRMDVPLLKTQ